MAIKPIQGFYVHDEDTSTDGVAKVDTSGVIGLVDGLNRLDDLAANVTNNAFPLYWFEKGSLSNAQNDTFRQGSRARTRGVLEFPYTVSVGCTAGSFYINYVKADGSDDGWSGWQSAGDVVVINAGTRFKVLATTNQNAPESQVDPLETIVGNLVFYADTFQGQHYKRFGLEFGHGNLLDGADDDWHRASRARSNVAIMPYPVAVSMNRGQYIVQYVDGSGNFMYGTDWATNTPHVIPAKRYFRLLLTLDASADRFRELDEIVRELNFDIREEMPGLSPNIIYQCRNVDDTRYPPYSKWYIQAAAHNQYDRVRFNVRKTTDGYFFLCHDNTINSEARNADGSAIGETIQSNGQTLATLNSYDWGIKYGNRYKGAGVPLLEDALKYCALYNLGVSIEHVALPMTDEDIDATLELYDKYGVTDNLMIGETVGNQVEKMKRFVDHNPRISACVGATSDWWTSENIEKVKTLQTPYNKVYVQLFPWRTYPTSEFITMAKSNGFILTCGFCMSKADLLNDDMFNHGFGFIEANNVYNIKDTVREWADGLVDGYENATAEVSQGTLTFSQGDAQLTNEP